MNDEDKRKKLVNFLNENALNPILEKSEDDFKSQDKKEKFKDVKRSTESEKERFENYDSAKEVKDNYLNDLNSEPAKMINRELDDLNLPKLPDYKKEFLNLCEKLEVK